MAVSMNPLDLNRDDALLIVDVQNDFCPGGALPVDRGDTIVPILNRWIRAASQRGAVVVASRDWHPEGHVSFEARGGPWPRHCVQQTEGARFHPELDLPDDVHLVSKGQHQDQDQYSAMAGTGLAEHLRRAGVHRVFVGGLAQDVCVWATVLDARAEGFEVHLIEDATRGVDPREAKRAMKDMRRAGVVIDTTDAE